MLPYTYIDTNTAEKEYNKDLKQWDVGETKSILDNQDLSQSKISNKDAKQIKKSYATGNSSGNYYSHAIGYGVLQKTFSETEREISEETQALLDGIKEIRKRVTTEHDKRWKMGDSKIAEVHRAAILVISDIQDAIYWDRRVNREDVEILAKYIKREKFEDTKKYLTTLSQLLV